MIILRQKNVRVLLFLVIFDEYCDLYLFVSLKIYIYNYFRDYYGIQ